MRSDTDFGKYFLSADMYLFSTVSWLLLLKSFWQDIKLFAKKHTNGLGYAHVNLLYYSY
jgi:hypothetical protein